MRDLDARAQNLMKIIDKLADEYLQGLRNTKSSGPDKRKEQMSNIQKQFNKAKEYGDDKVQLAIQTYELVSYLTAKNYSTMYCTYLPVEDVPFFFFYDTEFLRYKINQSYKLVQSLALKLTVLRSTFLCLSIVFSLATVILYAKNCTKY
jgi:uncharacterized protein YceK